MQFIKGVEEPTVPEVKLTRSKDGAQGTAIFYFEKPAVFENSGEMGEITGLYMIDDEGEMSTVRLLFDIYKTKRFPTIAIQSHL